jgi:hypothetical protein
MKRFVLFCRHIGDDVRFFVRLDGEAESGREHCTSCCPFQSISFGIIELSQGHQCVMFSFEEDTSTLTRRCLVFRKHC